MTLAADPAPFGTYTPEPFVRAVLALTRALPASWFGFRLSTPFRRVAINWLGEQPIDTEVWGAKARLYPARNSSEKNALFTPQIFDALERGVLATAIDASVAAGRTFTFVDIGANAGLYSLFVAARSGGRSRILAAEPQPGIVDRLSFNRSANPTFDITVLPVAVTDRDGEVELIIHDRDRGGSHVNKTGTATNDAQAVRVPSRPLLALLDDAGVAAVDAVKIDIEGAEDLALAPFLREAPTTLLPRLLVIEDRPDWTVDLYALLSERGYVRATRSRHNVVLRLDGSR